MKGLLVVLLHDLGVINDAPYVGVIGGRGSRSNHGGPWCKSDNSSTSRLGHFSLFKLFFEHGFPNPPPGVGEPVLELLLINACFLHEHDLILWRGVWVGKVLRREQPCLEGGNGSGGQLPAGLAALLRLNGLFIVFVGGSDITRLGLGLLDVSHAFLFGDSSAAATSGRWRGRGGFRVQRGQRERRERDAGASASRMGGS